MKDARYKKLCTYDSIYMKSPEKRIYEDRKKINGAKGGDRVGVETNFRDMRKPLRVTEMF